MGPARRQAIEELRQRDGRHPLADALWAREDEARRQRPARHGTAEQLEQLVVTRDVAKWHLTANRIRRQETGDRRQGDTCISIGNRETGDRVTRASVSGDRRQGDTCIGIRRQETG
jgi:hypothetical protein